MLKLNKILCIATVGSAFMMAASPVAAKCLDGPFKVNFPAGRLDTRIQDIAHKTGCPINVDDSLLGNKRVRALRGTYTDAQLLNLSLIRAHLAASWNNDEWVISGQEDQ